jgi:hypothetical protein
MNLVPVEQRSLTRAQFEALTEVPPEEEWLANITNAKTRRAYHTMCGNSSPTPACATIWSCDRSCGRISSAGART